MKKFSKLIYFIIAFALITCMAILNPAITFADAINEPTGDNAISIGTTKIDSVLENGKQLNIPMPTVQNAGGAQKYIEVKDRTGYTYTYNVETGETKDQNGNVCDYFTLIGEDGQTLNTFGDGTVKYIQPKVIGKGVYNIRYKVVKDDKTYYSSTQSVQVKSLAYNWVFESEGSTKNIIPANSDATSSITLPLPKIVKSDDDTTAQQFTKTDKNTKIVVTKDGSAVDNALTESGDNLVFTPSLAENEQSAVYRIKYISSVAGFGNKEYEIRVSKDYNTTAELEVTHNSVTNAQAGATTVLPTANVTDKTHNKSKVEVNTVIIIKKGSTEVARLTNEYSYKFERGEYTIQYEVTDAHGNTATSKTYSFSVSDKKPYIVDYAEDYTVTETDGKKEVQGEVKTGVEYLIPNEIGWGGVTLPAIYGMDYVDGHNLTFTRRIELSTDSSVYYDIDKAKGEHGNGSLTEDNTEYNKAIKFTFPDENADDIQKHAGETYKVKYYATDSYGNEASATVYTFTVADVETLSYTVDKGLSIKFPTITEHLDVKSELKFVSATASETPSDSSIIADDRLEVRTYYYYGEKHLIENALRDYKTRISNNETYSNFDFTSQKYAYEFDNFYGQINGLSGGIGTVTQLTSADGYTTIKLNEDDTHVDVVTIFAVAINDQGQFVIKAQEVEIDDVTETSIPTISEINEIHLHEYEIEVNDYNKVLNPYGENVFNQNCDVYIPSITFADNDDSLEVTVYCYVNDPSNNVGVVIEQFAKNGIKLAKVHAGSYGTYYVVYTARDDAGNTMTYVQSFKVDEVKKASVVVTNGSQFSKKLGETLSLDIELQDDGDNYTKFTYTIDWDVTPGGLGSNKDSFKLEKEGTFNATINAGYDLNGTRYYTSTTVSVTVSAVSIDWTDAEDELVDRKEYVGNVYLPLLTVDENGTDLNAYPTVKLVKDDKETDVEVKKDENDAGYYFVAEDGVYKVTYTVEDAQYSTNKTKSFTITCGDIYEPTINIENDKLSGSTIAYNGSMDVSVTMTKESETGKYTMVVKGTNDDGTVFDYEMIVRVTDKDMEQEIKAIDASSYSFELTGDSCSSNGTNKWTISGVGDYKLSLTVKDKNGNETTKTIEFKVANKTEAKKSNDNVVGIVLIIISAVVLGGVILFFAFAGKKKSKKKLSK